MTTDRLRVAVIYGGPSPEHEVSVVSARCVIEAMDPDRYDVVPVAITKWGRWLLPAQWPGDLAAPEGGLPEVSEQGEELAMGRIPTAGGRAVPIDVAFPLVHGTYGEDGTLQRVLENAGLPYVGAGVAASEAGMDKQIQKRIWRELGLPVAPHLVVREADPAVVEAAFGSAGAPSGYPLFVKPARQGSSIGISRCRDRAALGAGLTEALRHDDRAIVEEAVDGRELECAVLGNESPEASVVGEIVSVNEFYDYEAKYLAEGSKTLVPAPVPDAVADEVRRLALAAYRAVGCAGMARVDFFWSGEAGVVINEINTIPGFTPISMYPKLWEAAGLSYPRLIDRLIELALERRR